MFVIFLLNLFYNFLNFNFSKFLVTSFCNLYYHFNYFVFLEMYLFNYHNNLNIFTKSFYYYDVYMFFIFFSMGLTLTIFLLFLSYFLSGSYFVISKSNKLKSYECGFDPMKSLGGTFKFNMQYFSIALIFLIFDLEILFLFPWISVSKFFMVNGYLYMLYSIMPFIFFLILGMFYEFMLNLMNWQFKI